MAHPQRLILVCTYFCLPKGCTEQCMITVAFGAAQLPAECLNRLKRRKWHMSIALKVISYIVDYD